jgi:hypothetical protein|tara:strand:- start:442 stop:741 length:300 start_codon:yes stop_codon:yes gene_type:complete
MAIKLFNLISGQECLVDIHEEKEDSYVCKNILQLIPDPKSGGVAMIGFPMFKEDSAHTEIGKDKIMCESKPLQELVNQYNQQTGTGIVTPPKKGLTLTS